MFSSTKKSSSSVFLWSDWKRLKGEERGEASRARHKRKRERWASTLPLTPQKHTERLVGRTEPRVKGERKGLFCAFRPSGAQRRIRTSIQPHKHTLTCTCIHTHLYLLEGGSDLSLCARPTRKQCSTLGVFHNVEEPLWKHWLVRGLLSQSAPLSCTKTSYG